MSAVLAISLWGAFVGLVVYGLSCDAVRWFKERREARRDERRAQREARRWGEIAELTIAFNAPSAPDWPWTR